MSKQKSEVVTIYNRSQQMLPIQVRPPAGDFYLSEQQIRLNPKQSTSLPKSHLNLEQLNNLQAKRMITIVYDSEKHA